ncbi:polysaccharide lyase 8 family protein [Roseateles sp.]|uniref:polysaccharide lyase 8 family protein n=1 Tax=Roseateles sp. TaxID=1971397 RepID=UPI0025E768E1|nr:polysaccharide lyase 8 family protein [Roseateles sp.]MBV8035139.1 polysaccharide lyase 8 family protein [Roseateles sp.]
MKAISSLAASRALLALLAALTAACPAAQLTTAEASTTQVAARAATAEAFNALRQRWLQKLVGPASLDRREPQVASRLRSQSDAALRALQQMHREPGAKALWDDIGDFKNPDTLAASALVTSNAVRLLAMAQAYGTPGSPTYRDVRLAAGISAGLDWLVREQYTAGRREWGNWWHWQIGTPLHLLDLLTLAGDAVPADLRQRCLDAINWYVPDPRTKTRADGTLVHETGANLLDKSLVAILSGMLGQDGARIASGRDAISGSLDYVTTDDGFYRDGSFIQHHYFAYAGSYGVVALEDYARLLYLLHGSFWPVTDPRVANVYAFARESFAPLLIDAAMPDAFRGRKLSQPSHTDRSAGRAVIGALASLAEQAPPADAAALRSAIKGWMAQDRNLVASLSGEGGGANVPLHELSLLKAIAADSSVQPVMEAPGARIYPAMDRAVLRGSGFAAVLSLTSPRTGAFEMGNGENLKGWWTGMGRLALYDADVAQFADSYWPTVDILRLPGTTTDRSGAGRPEAWRQYANPEAWVGGVALGRWAALGMAFSMREVTGSPLRGRKAWFLLGDRILALGSGIAPGAVAAETIVENRRLSDASGARLLVDGQDLPNGRRSDVHWAHLQDDKAGSSIGYVFPLGTDLVTERSERHGTWHDLHAYASKQDLKGSYQVLAIPHGSPAYAYLLLPRAGEAETRAAAAEPGLRIEANDEQAAVVQVPSAGVYAANLWTAGSAAKDGKPYVSSSKPVALLIQRSGDRMKVVVAEPTQREAALELTLEQPVISVGQMDAGVTVLATAPKLRLRVNTAGAAGASFAAEFILPAAMSKP